MTDFSKMSVQSVIALEARTSAEQDKRKTLLGNSKKLSAYAEQKEISTAKMRTLLRTNYENNKDTLKDVRAYMQTQAFKEKQEKQSKNAKKLKFRMGGASPEGAVKVGDWGASLIKMDDLK